MLRPLFATLLLALAPLANAQTPLTTVAERSGFIETGRYEEVTTLCDAFARRYPKAVRCTTFGTTPEGRPMKALVASTSGALTPEQAQRRGLPVVLVQGGIHAGEIDGKDAGFLALREVLEGNAATGALDKLVWVFVPVFNVDGHERFGAWNRPNQRGPKEMGWRTTAQNYNLNRDYLKADTPEMQAMLHLVQRWDPLVTVDLHATNGAQFEHDISIQVEPVHAGDAGLRKAGLALRTGVIDDLAKQGSLPLPYYPSFVVNDDPTSGFEDSVPPPRFSHGYYLLRNRIAMLVETHSWKAYPVRVRVTRNTVVSVLEHVAREGASWQAAAKQADIAAASLGGRSEPLTYVAAPTARTVDFRGYAYTRTMSEVSGAPMTRYDETTPQIWKVPLKDDIRPGIVVDAPGAGYLVPAAEASWVAAVLKTHGVEYRLLGKAWQGDADAFRARKTRFGAGPVETHQRLTVEGDWQRETRGVPTGSLFVPIAQAKSRLVMALLEPQAPDSLLAWGRFNNAFERKEYMEDYVAETVAREMLQDPAVKAEFERRLRDDKAFVADPGARLEFFYRKHPSWDERYQLYPVLRVDTAP
ncbi:M14 family metallopeptidase [Pseudoxanthomonas sp. LH2527]|uniref:M14 family metallopeptidase n=1 Tax=Pseudoxanthomonas sp. LH2527 TaxID=2923249 RepID=UPI001F13BFA0|nr:M14 family metallopeptidase [Pseudoxanthomonas sp. LH2527]MCH6481967.1 M14 family metallopeptidase [Pseudoxanthomonas sp. LH2527]